jgi:hypothetical protein
MPCTTRRLLPLGELAVVPGPHNANYAAPITSPSCSWRSFSHGCSPEAAKPDQTGDCWSVSGDWLSEQVRSGFHQLGTHPGQGTALQPGDVHLGAADPGRDFVLVQVLEEPQDDDLTF